MFYFRDGQHERVIGVWLNPGDCVSFKGELRHRWTHGVWRYWGKGQDPDGVLSSEKALDARIVLNVRHGLVTEKEQYDWYQYWWQDFPMEAMSSKNVKRLEHLQKQFGPFDLVPQDSDEGDEGEEDELRAVAEGEEWKPWLGGGKVWKAAKLLRVWDVERVVEVLFIES